VTRRSTAAIVFVTLCVIMVAAAVTLNIGWILVNGRRVLPLVFGIIAFALIIAGIIVYTVFLVRELHRNDQQDAFLNAVTHELKTPIASIRLYLETLKSRDVDETQRQEFYSIMLADSDRLLSTVEQVLRAGRTGHRRRRIANSVIDVDEMVRECLERTRLRYGLDESHLIYSDAANGAKVSGDPDELRAAFSNLLDNAVKYSDDEVQVLVSVSADEEQRVVVRVADKGIGIPNAQLKRIFKRFYRVPGRFMARVKGTGLGLFIVQSVVRKHGGRVYAESPGLGQGSIFTIQLPRV
jgi:two-component system sensor histidine kinase SenX3